MLNLPVSLEVLEVGFGELHKIDPNKFSKYDLVITSGAHLEMINKDYYELTYLVPFYPLQFTEADLVKGLVKAKKHGSKIILMCYTEDIYDLDFYETVLDLEVKRVFFSDLNEAEKLMVDFYKEGYRVVIGTSSICEIAQKNGINNVFIHSKDSLKLEIIKAYQLATTKNKMVQYAKVKDAILHHSNNPIFLLDSNRRIIDTNNHGIQYVKKKTKQEVIGERFDSLSNITFDDSIKESISVQSENDQILIEPIMINENLKTYLIVVKKYLGARVKNAKKSGTTLNSKYQFRNIIHTSSKMNKIILKTKQYAQSDAPLLIIGESGTGKELIAHSVHEHSERKAQPFLPVNCSAIPENILESELFGYEEGAFTGAKKGGKPGYFELAQNGTIFLDEISETSPEIQTKLLRVLQEKEVIRLGGKEVIPLDVRVIAATNKSLPKLIKQKTFRDDLFYRINVLQINVPPVRERSEDIPLLLNHLLIKHGLLSHQAEYLTNISKDNLISYNWPGNVREMENFAQRVCALTSLSTSTYDLVRSFTDILTEFLEQEMTFHSETTPIIKNEKVTHSADFEKLKIVNTLLETNGSKYKTAKKLEISRTTLWRKMKQYNIE
jgi:transcriptional regulator, propionate catabolism operon regulatory protein